MLLLSLAPTFLIRCLEEPEDDEPIEEVIDSFSFRKAEVTGGIFF